MRLKFVAFDIRAALKYGALCIELNARGNINQIENAKIMHEINNIQRERKRINQRTLIVDNFI